MVAPPFLVDNEELVGGVALNHAVRLTAPNPNSVSMLQEHCIRTAACA